MIPVILNKEFGVIVNFHTGERCVKPEGTATVLGDEVQVKSIEEDVALTDGERSMLVAQLRAKQICGHIGKYEWQLDD